MSELCLRSHTAISSPFPMSPMLIKAILRCVGVAEMYAPHEKPGYYQLQLNSVAWTEVHTSYKGKARAQAALASLDDALRGMK